MSNQKAFNEKMEDIAQQIKIKDSELHQKQDQVAHMQQELDRLSEELNTQKGRNANLQRDLQVSTAFIQQTHSQTTQQSEHSTFLKERVRTLESDLEHALCEKTDAACEVRRLTTAVESMEREMKEMKVQSMATRGDSQTAGATVQRLQGQLHGKQNDVELLMRAKEELEKVVKLCKGETLEAEKKAAEYYQQMIRSQENFQVLQSEQRILS